MRIRTLALASVALAAAGITAVATPAQAAEEKEVHCVGQLSASTAKVSCYDSFTVAIAEATGGRVTDAPADAAKVINDPAFAAKLDGSSLALTKGSGKAPDQAGIQSVVIEIDYDYTWCCTSTFTWTAPEGCETNPLGTVKYEVPDLTAYGWNDRINAFNNYSLCYSKHYEHAWFAGAYLGWEYGNHSLGVLDGEISSIQWS